MMFNDCSKAETKKKPPEEVSELTYQELYDTMLRQKEMIKVLQGEIDIVQMFNDVSLDLSLISNDF